MLEFSVYGGAPRITDHPIFPDAATRPLFQHVLPAPLSALARLSASDARLVRYQSAGLRYFCFGPADARQRTEILR